MLEHCTYRNMLEKNILSLFFLLVSRLQMLCNLFFLTCCFEGLLRYSQAEIVTHLAKALVLPLITFRVVLSSWAQLFEGRLAFNLGLNLTRVSLSCVQKHFLGQFSLLFLELPIINL